MNRQRKPREYMGALIMPADFNTSGMRWYARTYYSGTLRADTLAGIKELIRMDRAQSLRAVGVTP